MTAMVRLFGFAVKIAFAAVLVTLPVAASGVDNSVALRVCRDNRRESSMVHNMSLPYSDSVIESVSSFYASQPAR